MIQFSLFLPSLSLFRTLFAFNISCKVNYILPPPPPYSLCIVFPVTRNLLLIIIFPIDVQINPIEDLRYFINSFPEIIIG